MMRNREITVTLIAAAMLVGTCAVVRAQEAPPAAIPESRVTAPRPLEVPPSPEPVPPPPPPAPVAAPLVDQSGRSAPVGNIIGSPYSASQGFFTQADIQDLPLYRTTEFLEQVPGLIVTQHSGILKANQYFLRGFSLDHGTDLAGFVDDVPYNLPSNAHGQGYDDLNSVIPELVEYVDYKKGPYYADVGDFSSVGSVSIHLVDSLPAGIFKVEAGNYAWLRTVIANSGQLGTGTLLYAIETNYDDGPYALKQHAGRFVGLLKWTVDDGCDRLTTSLIAYNGSGNDPNQIPQRAVYAGIISSTGVLDFSDFLTTQRYTGNIQWQHKWDDGSLTKANIYGYYYSLDIFNNFTFFLADPINGDQNDQIDRRWVSGLNISHTWDSKLFGDCVVNTLGFQTRNDWLPHLGLHHTVDRQLINAVDDDKVDIINTDPYFQSQIQLAEKVRMVLGARGDFYFFNVNSEDELINSGKRDAKLFSPKFALTLGPWYETLFYFDAGSSFHSNDARSVVQTIDPTTGLPADRAPPLVRSTGCEFGYKTQAIRNLTSTFALWQLHLQQELVFDGDTGTTEPLRSSDRYGIEFSNTYQVCDWLTFDADYSWSHGRLLGIDPDTPGQYIPESITTAFSGGPTINLRSGFFAQLRYRYLGPRALIEDNSGSSRATNLFELNLGYRCLRYSCGVEVINLFNSNGHDIDYFYGTGLKTDPGYPYPPGSNGINDLVFRQLEPIQARFYFNLRW